MYSCDNLVEQDGLGDFLRVRGQSGDVDQALEYYERTLKIREELYESNPDSAQAARDVSVSLNKLGDFLRVRGQSGDSDQALEYYERSLKIREELYKSNPDFAQAARDVSVSLSKLGDFLRVRGQSGDTDQALEYYERSLKIAEELYESNSNSSEAARDVVVSLLNLSNAHTESEQHMEAEEYRRKCYEHIKVCLEERNLVFDQPVMDYFEVLKKEFEE